MIRSNRHFGPVFSKISGWRAGDAGKGPMWNKACLRYRKSQWHAGYAGEGSMWECGRGMPEYDRSLLLFITMACDMPAIGHAVVYRPPGLIMSTLARNRMLARVAACRLCRRRINVGMWQGAVAGDRVLSGVPSHNRHAVA